MNAHSSGSIETNFLKRRRAFRFSVFVLLYNLGVIVWGAFVRATGSGAGCGEHWPLCNGVVVPRTPKLETLIELSHRVTSGLSLLFVLVMAALVFRAFPRFHSARKAAGWAVVFILTEALIGAGLVLLGLVAQDQSTLRAWALALHLVNTFIFLGWSTATAWWSRGSDPLPWLQSRSERAWNTLVLGATIVVGISGGIAALGDTLFPASGAMPGALKEAVLADFSAASHWLLRLRIWHPILAVSVGLLLILFSQRRASRSPFSRKLATALTGVVLVQLSAGILNVALLAPVWMQLLHLLLADLLWIILVLLILDSSAQRGERLV